MSTISPALFHAQTHDGWRLELRRYVDPQRLRPEASPVLFIPGYGMNSYILAYHPDGHSMVGALVDAGFDVWTANLRGQGGARRTGGKAKIGFAQLALIDIPTVRDFVLQKTAHKQLTFVGCSLGASMLYAYLAHHPRDHKAAGMIAIGGPLRWEQTHPLMRVAFKSPALAGALPFKGTKKLAQAALPLVRRAPALLSIYMNAKEIDLSQPKKLTPTVDDPVPSLNKQIALWMQRKDLVVSGLNVTQALAKVEPQPPLLCLLANRDGIVPAPAALAIMDVFSPKTTQALIVGDQHRWFAHADLFISPLASERVFAPMIAWLDALPPSE